MAGTDEKSLSFVQNLQEVTSILKEAADMTAEEELTFEDQGWINLSKANMNDLPDNIRVATVKKARDFAIRDPMSIRAVNLLTDYSFGVGVEWSAEDKKASEVLKQFWYADKNKALLSTKGQRKSSNKLLIDGEIFFAIFLGTETEPTAIRRVDPLQITEFVSDPDDIEDVRFYKRSWFNIQGQQKEAYYRSMANRDNKPCQDASGKEVKSDNDAIMYHLAINDLGQRGVSYLLPALPWINLLRKFLASRAAISLALAVFAWKIKVKGGATSIATAKAITHEQTPPAGSEWLENENVDRQPIRMDSGASAAYQDGRMLKLQVSAATGWPEQYFGDISIGNLATAQTVELPVQKMCESYQAIWSSAMDDIFQLVLDHAGIPEDNCYVDIDFPSMTPENMAAIVTAIQSLTPIFAGFVEAPDVKQQALLAMGIQDTSTVLEKLEKELKKQEKEKLANPKLPILPSQTTRPDGSVEPEAQVEPPKTTEETKKMRWELAKVLRQFKEVVKHADGNGSGLLKL